MQNQIIEYINQFLLPFPSGYRKRFSTQNALAWSIEKWNHQLDKNGFAGLAVMNLFKAFDKL